MASVAFRLDSSNTIGHGHFFRCLILAQAMSDIGWTTHLITRRHQGSIVEKIEGPWELHILPSATEELELNATHSWFGVAEQTDAQQTQCIIEKLQCDWLVVDHYAVSSLWLQLNSQHRKKVLVIDDEALRPLACDMVLNNNFGATAELYQNLVADSTKVLTSSHYTLLNDRYQNCVKKRISKTIDKVLIAMGGTDPNQVSARVYRYLRAALPEAHIKIALSESASGLNQIKQAELEDKKLDLIINADLFSLNDWCDLAVGACGVSAWERSAQGVPTILITTAKNQIPGATRLDKTGANIYLGHFDTVNESNVMETVSKLTPEYRESMSNLAAALVNPNGGNHIIDAMAPKDALGLSFRTAETKDVSLLYHWQLEQNTRRFFRNKNTPSFSEHVGWFRKLLNSKACLLIAHYDNIACGYIRIDEPNNDGTQEISILIVDGFKGKKLGQKALQLVNEQFPDLHLVAEVLPENKASQKIFLASGYLPIGDDKYLRSPIGVR